jgi:hypothetical protein
MKRTANTILEVLSEVEVGYPANSAAAPGSVISANRIVHPSIFGLTFPLL